MLFDLLGALTGMAAVVVGYRFAPIVFRSLIVAVDESEFLRKDRLDLEQRFREIVAEHDLS